MANKNTPKKKKKQTKDAILRTPKEELQVEVVTNRKIKTERNAKRKILIIGEGPTEAAYFEGFKAIYMTVKDIFDVTVLPEKKEEGSEGYSSAKALLYAAMKKQKEEKIKYEIGYEQVWIVLDNDEQNAYKLDDNSLRQLQNVISENSYAQIAALQIKKMDVRIDAPEDKRERKRYFLTEMEYRQFLSDEIQGITTEEIDTAIERTTKRYDLERLFNKNLRAFFFENGVFKEEKKEDGTPKFEEAYFDKNCFNYLKIAFASVAFEHWLLLHFERCLRPFYNSEEVIKYFDDQQYFIKGEERYKKGWYLYENIDKPHIKAFFQTAKNAIKNNLWLNATQRSTSQREIYEYNPYSTVFELTLFLFGKNIPIIAIFGETVPIKEYDITATLTGTRLDFTLRNKQKKAEFLRTIYSFFEIKDLNGQDVFFEIKDFNGQNALLQPQPTNDLIAPNEPRYFSLGLAQGTFTYPLFVHFRTQKHEVIWVIP